VAAGALLVLAALLLVGSASASGQPAEPRQPGNAHSTFQPPGFGTGAGAGAADSGAGPAPYVQEFGSRSRAPQAGPAASPTAKRTAQTDIDGCDHAYGTTGQCVPWTFPPGVTGRCAWLRAHNFGPLPVHGPDRLGLDTNHDQIACGPGDP
jgi:hypothetical protein